MTYHSTSTSNGFPNRHLLKMINDQASLSRSLHFLSFCHLYAEISHSVITSLKHLYAATALYLKVSEILFRRSAYGAYSLTEYRAWTITGKVVSFY